MEAVGQQVEADTAGERGGGLALEQAFAGEVDRDQGGGLSRVHDEAGAVQAEDVGDAVGDDAPADAGEGAVADRVGAAVMGEGGVVVPDGAEEDTGPAVAQRRGKEAGVFEGLPGQFQRESLLRVHRRRLAR
ncbi:hypothetical protein OIE51_01465 [Streptomyces sp. NBC_01803]|nr:hypothetical protein [Streptomyces sp. NBC_01803]WSA47792.1 hypothetical protein OIE51_01465 [Streptomyces sp. NBC_01803]